MRYFDLHCDTITECFVQKKQLDKNTLHIDLQRGKTFSPYIQCFAAWIPDELRGAKAVERFCDISFTLEKEIQCHPDTLSWLSDKEKNTPVKAVLTVESGAALGGLLENVELLKKKGVAMVTLTWNGENELGYGVGAKESFGLTSFGKDAVRVLENAHILVDVSHASPALFWDVACIARKPFVASHSNAKKLCSHRRNLSDEQFFAIRDCKGLVGLNFYSAFLRNEESKATMDDIIAHADYFLALGGKDCLCMGSDFDGADIPPDMKGLQSISVLYERFLQKNYSEDLVEKIFYNNAANFFHAADLF